jgi:hypothetical protein
MNDDKHTVSYTSHDYHSMCQKSKEKVRKMQQMGMTTPHDPKDKPEDVAKQDRGYSILFSILFFS